MGNVLHMDTGGVIKPSVKASDKNANESNEGMTIYELLASQGREGKITTPINGSLLNASTNLVIINFDDSYNSQIDFAKPILDKYGFKATFFEICGRINDNGWEKLRELRKEGMDIQAHTMSHPNLNELSKKKLDFELGNSKECFMKNGFNTTIFAYPYGNGWNNSTVIESVAKNYDLARTDSKRPLTFLNCDQWKGINYEYLANDSSNTMPSCFSNVNESANDRNGIDSSSNMRPVLGSSRYAINSWSHKHIEGPYDYSNLTCSGVCKYYNNSEMLERFIEAITSQERFNKDGIVRAIPIIIYHAFVPVDDSNENKIPTDTSVNLFELEMKYLHDNGVKVLTMSDLGYDESRGTLIVRF